MSARCTILALFLVALPVFGAPELGDAAPALVVDELDGNRFDLATERGHVAIVNIWATWCDPCRAEMPILNEFYRKFHSQGVDLLGLSADDKHDEGAVRTVMHQFQFPAALLKLAQENGFGPARVVPITYVFDRQGILRVKLWPGGTPVTEENLEKAIQPLLAGGSAPAR